jgi:hypothetical protein
MYLALYVSALNSFFKSITIAPISISRNLPVLSNKKRQIPIFLQKKKYCDKIFVRFQIYANRNGKGGIMTDKQRDFVVRRWNLCESDKRIRLAAEFFKLKRDNQQAMSWWQFLEKRLST